MPGTPAIGVTSASCIIALPLLVWDGKGMKPGFSGTSSNGGPAASRAIHIGWRICSVHASARKYARQVRIYSPNRGPKDNSVSETHPATAVLAIRRIVAVAKALALVGSDMLADCFAIATNSCRRFGIVGSLCMRDASTPGLRGACLSRRDRVASCWPVTVSDVPVFVGPEPLSFAAAALVAPQDGVVAGPSNFVSSPSSSCCLFFAEFVVRLVCSPEKEKTWSFGLVASKPNLVILVWMHGRNKCSNRCV
jgi:hypothetical protein